MKCSPPKSQSIRSYFRSKPRRKQKRGPKKGETYYVAKSATSGLSCSHHHRTQMAALKCARREDSLARKSGRKPTYQAVRETA